VSAPGFFTAEFHLRFLPALLAGKWREARNPPQRSPFEGHVPLELTVVPIVCIVFAALGAPGALKGSIAGILLSLAGFGGFAALLFMALRSTWGEPLSYEAFSASVFFFVLFLGATAGVFYASLQARFVLPWALAGAVVGYPLGILAGLWNQKLGFLAFLTVLAARLGMFGLAVLDIVLLFGLR